MNYLLDKKVKKKKLIYVVFFCAFLLILFSFRLRIASGLSSMSHALFRPVLIFGNNIGGKLGEVGSFFVSKKNLYLENENLKAQLEEDRIMMANYNSVLAENLNLKETFGRMQEKDSMILAAILGKSNQSPYDTLIIDAGAKEGLSAGDTVFALGNVPIGRIAEAYTSSSKVILFWNSKERTQVIISGKDIFMEAVGRGGGNFEITLPRDITIAQGDEAAIPGIFPYVLAVVETIISDPRDPFVKALLVSPVNIHELKFVEVKPQK